MRPKPPARRSFRPGLFLRRRPRLRLALVALAAMGIGLVVTSTLRRAERAEAAWGTPRPVVLVTSDLAAGDRIDASSTDPVDRPTAVIPAGALTALPPDARAGTAVRAGEVLLESHLAPVGATEIAARLPGGTRAVAVPLEPGTTPPLAVDDHVDVLVALAPEAAGTGPPGFALTTDAVVVEVTDEAVTIAVPTDDAPRVAVALSQGAVTLALAPPT